LRPHWAGIARQLDLEDTIAALHRSLDEASAKAIEHERTPSPPAA